MRKQSNILLIIILSGSLFFSPTLWAAATSAGGVASEVIKSFSELAKLISASSYLAGLAFSIGAIMKFKQHKDNPTQIPIGTPIALVFIAAALLFFPSVLSSLGGTMFEGGGTVAGATGVAWDTGGN